MLKIPMVNMVGFDEGIFLRGHVRFSGLPVRGGNLARDGVRKRGLEGPIGIVVFG